MSLVAMPVRRVQRDPGLLGGEGLLGLRAPAARLRSGGGELLGGPAHPGGQIHRGEGVEGGVQLDARPDALAGAPQPDPVEEMRPRGFEEVGRFGMGGEGGLERQVGRLLVRGGQPAAAGRQRPQPRRGRRRGDGGEPVGQVDRLVASTQGEVGLDEVGGDAERFAEGADAAVGGEPGLEDGHGRGRVRATEGAEGGRDRLVGREGGGAGAVGERRSPAREPPGPRRADRGRRTARPASPAPRPPRRRTPAARRARRPRRRRRTPRRGRRARRARWRTGSTPAPGRPGHRGPWPGSAGGCRAT